jgi:hypothetical protein
MVVVGLVLSNFIAHAQNLFLFYFVFFQHPNIVKGLKSKNSQGISRKIFLGEKKRKEFVKVPTIRTGVPPGRSLVGYEGNQNALRMPAIT